jgi:chitin disaccharide deacetylase
LIESGGDWEGLTPMKFLIINGDDFGYGHGVNRAIVELHDRGVLTSAGLMVNTSATAEAVALAAARPRLSLGLHVNFTNEGERLVEFDDPQVCRRELRRQFDHFVALTGRIPTHIDSHQEIHRRRPCQPSFVELAEEHGLPLRSRPPVTFKGSFYAQWEHGVSEPEKVSFEALSQIVSTEVTHGIYELGVHPGYHDAAAHYVYNLDREWELATLSDSRLLGLLRELGVELISYHDLPRAVACLDGDGAA